MRLRGSNTRFSGICRSLSFDRPVAANGALDPGDEASRRTPQGSVRGAQQEAVHDHAPIWAVAALYA